MRRTSLPFRNNLKLLVIALFIVGTAVSSVGTGVFKGRSTVAATQTANLWVAPSGGSSNCQRSATPIDYASAAGANAKCDSVATATAKASSSVVDTVGFTGTNYNTSLSMSGDSKAVKYVGAGDTTVFTGFSLGGTTSASAVSNKTFESFKSTGGSSFMNANSVNVNNVTILDFTYMESSSYLNFDNVDFNGNYTTDDTIDVYEQDRSQQPNNNITITHSKIHGARASVSTSHPDGIQFCNCSGSRGDAYHATAITISKSQFYDNECINVRTNPGTGLTLTNNIFKGSVNGLSGCNYYIVDVIGATGTISYNTFLDGQSAQGNSSFNNGMQYWTGNAGAGVGQGCDVKNATWNYNVWTQAKCGTTDKKVTNLMLAADGTPQAGSPVIGAGGSSGFPTTDFKDNSRTAPTDAGAIQLNATSGGGGGGGGATYTQADLTNLLSHFAQTTGMTQAQGDLNADGAVNIYDLGILLASYSG